MRSSQDISTRKSKEVKKASGRDINSEKMATDSLTDRSSPDPNCSICLSKMKDKSFTDRCFHMFCFECLVEWSKINAVCPLCKQPFKQIFHNIRSMSDYDVYDVLSHSSILPSLSSQAPTQTNILQPLLTNCHDVRLFLSQTTNEMALSRWLIDHIRNYIRVDAMQASFISNLIIDLIQVWPVSSQQFYESIVQFFTHQTLDFIHSLDHHLHLFMRQDSRDHSLEVILQRMRSNSGIETIEGNQIVNIPTNLATNHRALRNSTTSRHFIDGVLQSNSSNPSFPGPSRFSLLLSIFRPTTRNGNTHTGSSSSSSPPREDELIDIEQLDENPSNSQTCKSPICVSSGEENHVQLVECSSKTKTRHLRKRRQQTFLLVSSDDEGITANEGRKRIKISSDMPDRDESNKILLQQKSSSTEVKVTFKKHPTGHKNSLNKFKTCEKPTEEEKSGNSESKVDRESTGNSFIPGSSSSQDVTDNVGVENPTADCDDSSERQPSNLSGNRLTLVQTTDCLHQKSCVVLDDTLEGELEDEKTKEDPIDVDTISVYSDDSIQWIDDVSADLLPTNENDIMESKNADIIIVFPRVSVDEREKLKSTSRKRHLFVDLSDDNDETRFMVEQTSSKDAAAKRSESDSPTPSSSREYIENQTTENFPSYSKKTADWDEMARLHSEHQESDVDEPLMHEVTVEGILDIPFDN